MFASQLLKPILLALQILNRSVKKDVCDDFRPVAYYQHDALSLRPVQRQLIYGY
jgi:hypothetical protein